MLNYLLKEPTLKSDKNPLLLLIHGYGSDENDLFSFAAELPEQYYIVSVQAPYSLYPYGYAWYAINFDADENKFSDIEQAKTSRDELITFIDQITKLYPIDTHNISLIGFSQGAILSLAIGLSYPQKIKKIVALSGYLNEQILTENYKQNSFDNLDIFVSHGTVDQVIPVDWARKTKPFLEALHIKNVYQEYNIGHGVSPKMFMDFKQWLNDF
jgi:phospholipase/carboxylesterase